MRWNISGSINNGNASDSNKYFFMNFFDNQLGNSIQYHTTHSSGYWSFQNYWNSQGNNYLRMTCRTETSIIEMLIYHKKKYCNIIIKMLEKNTIMPDNIITINNYKEGCEKSVTFKVRIDEIRTIRNKLLKDSDYYLLPDISLEENKLNEIKVNRQHLRDFMNKLMSDEITCDIFDDEFEKKYFPT